MSLLTPNPLWDAPVGSVVDMDNNPVATAAEANTEKWAGTPYVSKRGNPIATKTTIVMSGKSKGAKRTIYAEYVGGKYKRISLYEIKTGRKPNKKKSAKKDACKGKKRSVKRSSSAPKSEIAKARRKFNRRSKLKKKIDRSIQAETVVTKSRDYKPNKNDFKGVDTKRR